MDYVGALISFQKKRNKLTLTLLQEPDDAIAKRRVFSGNHVASVAENELQTNEALSTVLESFPDEQKAVDGRSWLPLHHFAVSLQQPNPVSY